MSRVFPALLAACLAAVLVFLGLPVVGLLTHTSPARLAARLSDPVSLDALRLSLETTLVAVAVIAAVGTPAAYLLATRSFRGRSLASTIVELPLVLPPAVAGIALLAAFGPRGVAAGALGNAQLVFATAGVVVAQVFVASPFFVRQAQTAFGSIDRRWLEASRTLGASEAHTFARIAVPAARAGLVTGLALAWGRALGEFGATLLFAGSLRGVTQTVPLAIYGYLATDFTGAVALSVVLVAVAAALLITVRAVAAR